MALALPTAERTAVFRAMVSILRNDPIVSRVCKAIKAWEGKPTDAETLVLGMAPVIRLTPVGTGDEWMSPASVVGTLTINVEMLISGYNADDMGNLWRAIIAAFYAPTGTTFEAVQSQLRAAGAYPPSPMFGTPAFDARPEEQFLFCVAAIQVKVQTQLSSRGTPAASS